MKNIKLDTFGYPYYKRYDEGKPSRYIKPFVGFEVADRKDLKTLISALN